mmetsp:Transcript_13259/g.20754  ORF Transcript_13259/g.20754 Transcript_13259/m.20754 type:complete len:112 (+) Transcript_13259:3498-3833(+)
MSSVPTPGEDESKSPPTQKISSTKPKTEAKPNSGSKGSRPKVEQVKTVAISMNKNSKGKQELKTISSLQVPDVKKSKSVMVSADIPQPQDKSSSEDEAGGPLTAEAAQQKF